MFDVDHFKQGQRHPRSPRRVDSRAQGFSRRGFARGSGARTCSRATGGEEFACVLPSTALPGGIVFAEHLRTIIAERPCLFREPEHLVHDQRRRDHAASRDRRRIRRASSSAPTRTCTSPSAAGRNRVVPSLQDLLPA